MTSGWGVRPALVVVCLEPQQATETVESLTAQVRRRLPGVDVRAAFVTDPEQVAVEVTGPTVAVPLALDGGGLGSTMASLLAQVRGPLRVARPLGPHPLLAAVMCERLQAAGARRGDAVAMVAATSDSDSVVDAFTAARLLQSHWGAPVRVAHLAGGGERISSVVDGLWRDGHRRIAAVPYLLGPGSAAQRARTQAGLAGCTGTADVLGAHRLVVELVVRRYLAAAAPRRAARTGVHDPGALCYRGACHECQRQAPAC